MAPQAANRPERQADKRPPHEDFLAENAISAIGFIDGITVAA
jgi:hypothetical protein